MKSILIREIPEELHKEIKLLAVEHGTSMSKLIAAILGNFVRRPSEDIEKDPIWEKYGLRSY